MYTQDWASLSKFFLMLAALLGGLSVAIGAFGAHALKATLEANQRLDTFELASRYQFYHSLALLGVALLMLQIRHIYLVYAAYGFIMGILIFSGSLYALALSNKGWLGAITPIGGVAMIVGWVFLFIGIYQGKIQ
ncbi:MAG: DUF423 domain-containing protein [Microscillaceae bacterium]|nr:DUF423 domain-containing protein [Microscillaceae bacterium]